MSSIVRDRTRTKLATLLGRADDEWFLQLAWAVDAVQAGRGEAASSVIVFPADVEGAGLRSPYSIHPWELETLINELFIIEKDNSGRSFNSYYTKCDDYRTMLQCVALLRRLENAESGQYLKRMGIFSEMHRIAQRQFHWQRGYLTVPQFYRSAYVYGGKKCAAHFLSRYGISIDQFSVIGFAIYAATDGHPLVAGLNDLSEIGITEQDIQAALALCALSIPEARGKARAIRKKNWPTAYQPSVLRQAPVLICGEENRRLRVPIRDLLLQRITSGIFYDLVSGSSDLRNESAERFESYAYELMRVSLPAANIEREFLYHVSRTEMKSPDILIELADEIELVVECKGTKMSVEAQYSERPEDDARSKLDELAKGVFQIWRFYSHIRIGLVNSKRVGRTKRGVVLTLDPWMTLARDMQAEVFARATRLADADRHVELIDMCSVIFCPIYEMEDLLSTADEGEFWQTLDVAQDDEFLGWMLPQVHSEAKRRRGEIIQSKGFPFDIGAVLPWWQKVSEIQGRQMGQI